MSLISWFQPATGHLYDPEELLSNTGVLWPDHWLVNQAGRALGACAWAGIMHVMEEVIVRPISLERLAAILPDDRAARLASAATKARATFGDRVVWHVNATAHGGGVA